MSANNIGLLCDANQGQLLIIDIQERLAATMPEHDLQQVITSTQKLQQAATLLDMPVIMSEQYPKGLGKTLEALQRDDITRVEKTCFSCTEAIFKSDPDTHRRQFVLAGMEAHICVLQTAIELKNKGYEIFIVEDAVCSRNQENKQNALHRLRQAGVIITNLESVLFEWVRDAKHEHFKAISGLIK